MSINTGPQFVSMSEQYSMFSPPMSAAGMESNMNAKMKDVLEANFKHRPADGRRTHLSRNHYRRGRSLGVPTVSDEAPSAACSL